MRITARTEKRAPMDTAPEELVRALDGLYAYDSGSGQTGIHDEELRTRCIVALKRHTETADGSRVFFSNLIRDMWLTDDAIAQGYGIEDALQFVDWLDDRMQIHLR